MLASATTLAAAVAFWYTVVRARPPLSLENRWIGHRHDDAYFQKRQISAQNLNLFGRVALITGGSSGVGMEVARSLYAQGCTVIITSRSQARADQTVERLVKEVGKSNGKMEGMMLELSDLDDVRRFSKVFSSKYDQVNYVVMNGGQPPLLNMLGYEGSGLSQQGYDMLFAGNYLGHFLLFQELLPTLLKSSPARATATSSISHWVHDSQLANLLPEQQKEAKSSTWAKVQQYGNTKLLQVMMCFEAQRRLTEQGLAGHLTVTPVTPGCVNTAITNLRARDGTGARNPLAKSAAEGAATTLYALLSAENEGATGVFVQPFWSPKHRSPPLLGGVDVNFGFEVLGQRFTWGVYRWLAHPDAYAAAFSRELWDASVQATAAKPVL